MKKKLLCLLTVLGCFQMNAQYGSLDSTFGVGGKVVTSINNDEVANSLVLQSDGKIVVAGYTYSSTNGNDIVCIRYNIDGTLDSSFGTNGIVTYDVQAGSDDKALSIAIQSDNKLVLAGYSDNGTDKEALVMRLNSDGTLDNSFGSGGKVLTGFSTTGVPVRQDEYRVVKIHALTGNIVVGGSTYSASNNSRAVVARYTSIGILDTSFATGGKFTGLPNSMVSSTYLFSIEDLAIKSNGKITVAGPAINYLYFARLNENGTMDTTFSSNGYYDSYNGRTYALELNNDDSFYFTGDISTLPETRLYTGSVNANGGGIKATSFNFGSTTKANSYAIAKDSNGKLVVAGFLEDKSNGSSSFLLGRLLADHNADNTFGNNGFVTTTFDNSVSAAYDMKIQTDGKIVLVGKAGSKIALARYDVTTLGIDDLTKHDNFKVYPVPADDYLYVTLSNSILLNSPYYITDVSGRIVLSGILYKDNERVDVGSLKSGIYFVNLDNKVGSVKFIKK